jgi:hypothetical protein
LSAFSHAAHVADDLRRNDELSPENWHAMFAVGALPGLVLIVGMYLLPESPR